MVEIFTQVHYIPPYKYGKGLGQCMRGVQNHLIYIMLYRQERNACWSDFEFKLCLHAYTINIAYWHLFLCPVTVNDALQCYKCGKYQEEGGSILPCHKSSFGELVTCRETDKYCMVSSFVETFERESSVLSQFICTLCRDNEIYRTAAWYSSNRKQYIYILCLVVYIHIVYLHHQVIQMVNSLHDSRASLHYYGAGVMQENCRERIQQKLYYFVVPTNGMEMNVTVYLHLLIYIVPTIWFAKLRFSTF